MVKMEKWLKVRVHSVALGRYISEDGPEVAPEEIELMTGENLLFAARWTKGDTVPLPICSFVCLVQSGFSR
jgi:hypothetical protein